MEVCACKPDFVWDVAAALTPATSHDDHFSAATIARRMVCSVAKTDCDQPEDSAGRVNVFCLVLHRTRVARPRRRRRAGALLPHLFTLTISLSRHGGLFSVVLSRSKCSHLKGRR